MNHSIPKAPVHLLIFTVVCTVLLVGQQSQTPADQDQSLETLKVQVNVVQLFFNVKDKKGALIPSQKKEDFEIFEDGKPQTIKYFTAESNLPLTLGILIDSSGSQMRVLEMEKEVGGAFLSQILREKDEADFRRVLPAMDGSRRSRLSEWVAQVHPGHPWLERLSTHRL